MQTHHVNVHIHHQNGQVDGETYPPPRIGRSHRLWTSTLMHHHGRLQNEQGDGQCKLWKPSSTGVVGLRWSMINSKKAIGEIFTNAEQDRVRLDFVVVSLVEDSRKSMQFCGICEDCRTGT